MVWRSPYAFIHSPSFPLLLIISLSPFTFKTYAGARDVRLDTPHLFIIFSPKSVVATRDPVQVTRNP